MSATQPSTADHDPAGLYEICIKGHLNDRWADWFEGMTITRGDDGETLLRGLVVDQAALYGLLRKVRYTGLPLVSVIRIAQPDGAEGDTDRNRSEQETNTSNRRTTSIESHSKESNMRITGTNLIRWAGLSAMIAGVIFAGIQPIHPLDLLPSVTTTHWAIIQSLKTSMCLFGLLGLTGLYARQVNEAGWLGLIGYLLFGFFFAHTLPLAYAEAFILPLLATEAPRFVEGFLGIFNDHPIQMNLGALPMLYALAGSVGYVFGGLLFGIATFRAGILPRWAAGLLAVGSLAPFVLTMLPHPLDRTFAVPTGLALVWLGYALWSERRERASEPVSGTVSPQLRHTGAK